MMHQNPEYLSLAELLDQNLSAYEYFQTLPPEVQGQLRREDGAASFEELQARAVRLSNNKRSMF